MTDPQSPLAGIRICDLTTVVMGPLATRMLADMGADVIRVETPEGDILRDHAPMRSPKMSAFSMSLNRNKRSVVLDLKTEQGHRALCDLISSCDVFVTNMRRAALARLGLDEDPVRELRPDIVYCVANGFGSDGPRADEPAYDDVVQAASGLAGMFAWNGDAPQLLPSIYADKVSGVHIAFAIAAALYGRSQSGEGISIEVPMAETMAAFNLVEHLGGLTFEPPQGDFSYSRLRNPNRHPRRTKDGWMVIMPYSRQNWHDFWEVGGRTDLQEDERFATHNDRAKNADLLYETVDPIAALRTTAEWREFCAERSIPASEVLDLDNILDDEHFAAVGLLQEDDHPTEGAYRWVRNPIQLNGQIRPIDRHAPRLGADIADVFAEIGYDQDQIASLQTVDD